MLCSCILTLSKSLLTLKNNLSIQISMVIKEETIRQAEKMTEAEIKLRNEILIRFRYYEVDEIKELINIIKQNSFKLGVEHGISRNNTGQSTALAGTKN